MDYQERLHDLMKGIKTQTRLAYDEGYGAGYAKAKVTYEKVVSEKEDSDRVKVLTAALEKIRNELPDKGFALSERYGRIAKAIEGAIGEKPHMTLKEIRESCTIKWTLEHMNCIFAAFVKQHGGILAGVTYIDYESGTFRVAEDGKVSHLLATLFDRTPEEILEASRETYKRNN